MQLHPEEYRALILQNQFLTRPGGLSAVAGGLCGIQAQYHNHTCRALSLRCGAASLSAAGHLLVKSWTLRGTLHAFPIADLPLFLHAGRRPFLRPVDTMETDSHATAARKACFSALILDALQEGPATREDLKALCQAHGMTASEQESLFNPWGGLLRALCEAGRICHSFTKEKIFVACPDFAPMDGQGAKAELLSRYLLAYGPATIADAAYFFGTTQKNIKALLSDLSVAEYRVQDQVCFGLVPMDATPPEQPPFAIFLGGFDPLLLGYDPRNSPFFPPEHRQKIFTAGGQVQPALLINSTVAGRWKLVGRKLSITLFSPISPGEQSRLQEEARQAFPNAKELTLA